MWERGGGIFAYLNGENADRVRGALRTPFNAIFVCKAQSNREDDAHSPTSRRRRRTDCRLPRTSRRTASSRKDTLVEIATAAKIGDDVGVPGKQ